MSAKKALAVGIKAAVCVLCLAVLVSCSKKEVVFEKAPFTLNPELVGDLIQIPELSLEFGPPAGWKALDSAQLDNFRKMLGGTDLSREFYPVFPVAVFVDSITGCMVYIAQIEEDEAEMPQIAEHYVDFITPRLTSSAITPANYTVNDLNLYYYMLHSTDVVNYKIVGETAARKRFLIEFIIGGVVYAQIEPSVSSSLATLKSATAGDPSQ